jgi:lipopolysaccharide transport system permease protein
LIIAVLAVAGLLTGNLSDDGGFLGSNPFVAGQETGNGEENQFPGRQNACMSKLVIDASQKGIGLNFKELYRYRDLFWILAYRDLRVRYAQTFLGLLWGIIQPLATLLIFTLIFSRVVRVNTGSIPYPVFALSGMTAWTYFSFVMNQAGNSIISAQGMIQKIYFPRLIIPLSKAVVGLADFGISLVFLGALLIWFRVLPGWEVVFLPVFILFTLMAALGIGIWLSALTIRYRDFQQIVPFMVQFGLYATPVGYPASLLLVNEKVSQWVKVLYFLNPMAGIAEGFRWSLIGGTLPLLYVYLSLAMAVFLLISGLFYFRSVEKVMADIV